jgi:hypothetical protein
MRTLLGMVAVVDLLRKNYLEIVMELSLIIVACVQFLGFLICKVARNWIDEKSFSKRQFISGAGFGFGISLVSTIMLFIF